MNSPSPLAGEGGAPARRVRGASSHDELQRRAREMRASPTAAERRLWSMLRDRRMPIFKFKRQFVIDPYIVDFVCFERRLIIEADGGQHCESEYDLRRDAFLNAQGFTVLRFWNNEVLENAGGVFEAIYAELKSPHPPIATQWVPPSPARGEGLDGSAGTNG